MPTISTHLKMLDQFSSPLQRVSNQVNTAIVSMERMRRLTERPAKLNIDTSNVQKQLTGIQRITQISKVSVSFNAKQTITKAQLLRNQIQKQFNGIQAKIRVELPANLTVMFTNLQQLMLKLIAETRRLGATSNNTNQLQSSMQKIKQLQEQVVKLQNQINSKTRQSGQASASWLNNLKGVAATYLSFQGVKIGMNVSDDYVNTLARLDLINDKTQTTYKLQEKIFASADRARGSYTDMAAVMGRMGILASDAFSSNDELISFTELMQKSFRVGGSGTMEQQSGMYQLSQAMAAGKLQGDEFRSIMENAPMLAAAIADFTGKSKGELKDMSADGEITADIIKGAMFHAADDINSKFETMPKTFGDIFTQLKNSALQSFGGVIEEISKKLNGSEVDAFAKNMGSAFADAAIGALGLLSILSNIYEFVSTNWAVIAPILWGVATAMGALLAVTIMTKVATLAVAAATVYQTIVNFAATLATYGLATAWRTLNTAMKANVIILIISIVIALIVWLVNLWNTNDKFAAGLMRAWNSILNFFDQIPIFFMRVGMGITNAFMDMKVDSLRIMELLVNGVIDGVNWLIEKLNKIPGVSLDAVSHVEFTASAAAEAEAVRQAGEKMISLMEDNAATKAAAREQKVLDMLGDRAKAREKDEQKKNDELVGPNFAEGGYGNEGKISEIGKVKEVGKIKDNVDISSEDLKMMRELAEMKNIQNYVTLTPSISFGDTHVRNESDINTIVAQITQQLDQDIATSVDSVYV
ncbi:MAG TPA: tape measure protein [Candidatus Paenibacillus intestinavium]|nr:tape measure protein [Candidatus Paenibacillus intestinavium]